MSTNSDEEDGSKTKPMEDVDNSMKGDRTTLSQSQHSVESEEKMDNNDEKVQPSTSGSIGEDCVVMKRRSSSAHKRHYRNSHGAGTEQGEAVGMNSDDDEDGIPRCSPMKERKPRSEEHKKSQKPSSGKETDEPMDASDITQGNDEEVTGASPVNQPSVVGQHDDTSQSSSTTTSGPDAVGIEDDDEDLLSLNDDEEENAMFRRMVRDQRNADDDISRRLAEAAEMMSSSSSSSSLSMHPEGEDDESSSSTSDCILEDLDEDEKEGQASSSATRSKDGDSSTATPSTSKGTDTGASTADKKENKPAKSSKKVGKRKFEKQMPSVLLKSKPKHNWNGPSEIFRREMGLRASSQPQSAEIFRSRFYGSLFSVERLELYRKLEGNQGHHGCVNCLNFSYSGTKLASGSDDLHIKVWNYNLGTILSNFHTGHRANVFQSKFLPFLGLDTMIVSCARDSQVRLHTLDTDGTLHSTKKIAQHRGAAHKLSVSPDNPHVILSCGEDSFVYSIDIREDKPQRLLSLRERNKKVALYSISCNPFKPEEFCISGRDEFVRIYDARTLRSFATSLDDSDDREVPIAADSDSAVPLKKFCPQHLVDSVGAGRSRIKANVTAAMYSYNGSEIVASYNDENIYLFNTSHSDMADHIKVYEGHRNNATVKGVNFFGDRSQYIVSGSDCGHIFFWDKETEAIVNFLRGDENGVVNCLEPHPTVPIIATSGLDDDVKVWIPSNEHPPKMSDLAVTVRKNQKNRLEENKRPPDEIDGHFMWALWNHMRRAERLRRRDGPNGDGDSDSDDSWAGGDDDDEDEDSDTGNRGVECRVT